jgi:abortive infection bacteriophage resistance protein
VEALFDFDKKLRGIIYEYAQNVECNLKALISDEISKNYGVNEREYLREENFSENPEDLPNVRWIIGTCKSTLKDCCREGSGSYREYVVYYKERYGHVPFWALVRALSFGNISKLLRLMKREDGVRIAKEYGVSFSELCALTEVFVAFRNIAAHGERAYCARLQTAALPTTLPVCRKLGLTKGQGCGENDFFAFMIAAKYLLSPSEYDECHERVVGQVNKLEKTLPAWAFDRVMLATGLSGSWRNLDSMYR